MKNAVFWDVAPCISCVKRRFGGTYRLHLQGRKIRVRGTNVCRWLQTPSEEPEYLSTLKMETIRSSETSVHTTSTRCPIPEDGILHYRHCTHFFINIALDQLLPPVQPQSFWEWTRTSFEQFLAGFCNHSS
jgi:hypothetical protein